MASYRLSASVISRGDGRSAIAAAAYRSGTLLIDERTQQEHDYRRRGGVADAALLLPENTPQWMADRAALWNAVEKVETRGNAQLSREIQLSLPHELSGEQRRELVHGFVRDAFVSKGMIADVAIHEPQVAKGENPRNHHAHVMLTMRELTGEGFHEKKATPKARSWNDRKAVSAWREQWAQAQNAALERHGHDDRVTHKSLADQGIRRLPEIHLGVHATVIKRRGGEHPRLERYNERLASIKRRNARLEIVEQGRKRQLQEAKREAAQLRESVRKAGLLGFWQKLTGRRRAELRRLEDVQAEAARAKADAVKAAQLQEVNRREQAKILSRQKAQAANDPQRRPEKPPGRPMPSPASSGRPMPMKPSQKPTRPLTAAKKAMPAPPSSKTSMPKPPRSPQRRRDGDPDLER